MAHTIQLIKADYLQRTRSYAFLLVLALTVYAAYSFVPPPEASYTTLRAAGYRGEYNAAWVGYSSAAMTTVMLSFFGFLLVNSGIRKDMDTGVGLIIATTPLTNFRYLLSKQISNFLVLLTIACCAFFMSVLLFLGRNTPYPFVAKHFLFPYLVFAVPALFAVAAWAVVAEVVFRKRTALQLIVYFTLFMGLLAGVQGLETGTLSQVADPFGLSLITDSIKRQINSQFGERVQQVSFGFVFSAQQGYRTFTWEGVSWQAAFLLSRLVWMGGSLGLVYLSAFMFHRFDTSMAARKRKETVQGHLQQEAVSAVPPEINRRLLPPVVQDYGVFPFIKTEFLLLVRRGNKWWWWVTGCLWVSTWIAPLALAHAYLLPVLWFTQVTQLSDLATKDKTNRLHYFSYATYRPLFRLLPSQIVAGVALVVVLALPVLVRCLLVLDVYAAIHILNGSILIVLAAVCLGIASGGSRLYEVLFFLLTYSVVNKIPEADYLGSQPHGNQLGYVLLIGSLNVAFALVGFGARAYQARRL